MYVMNDQALEALPGDFYATRSYTDFLIDAVRDNRDDGRPFLAYLAFNTPHDPLHVPEPWRSRYPGRYDHGYEALKAGRVAGAKRLGLIQDDAPVPEGFSGTDPWDSLDADRQALEARAMEVYAGMVNNMDYHYGRIEAFLRDIGELDDTIVISGSAQMDGKYYF